MFIYSEIKEGLAYLKNMKTLDSGRFGSSSGQVNAAEAVSKKKVVCSRCKYSFLADSEKASGIVCPWCGREQGGF